HAEGTLTEEQERLLEIYSYIKDYHVSGTPEEDILYGAIYGMIWSLEDPYTDYFTDEEYDQFIQEIEGETQDIPDIESKLLPNRTGYIKISTFSTTIDQEFEQHLTNLKKRKADKFIIDLRGNPGGFVDSAVNLSEHFIDEGPVVRTKDRSGEEIVYEVTEGTKWNDPLVLLVDENTASAAEMITAIVKDYELGTIIGMNTFGKGTVQSLIPLVHGGVLKLTVDQYFSPKGKEINGVGIAPHIVVPDPDTQLDFAQRFLKNGQSLRLTSSGEMFRGQDKQLSTGLFHTDDHTYISLKTLASVFGGDLYWDEATRSVYYILGDDEPVWQLNDKTSPLFIHEGTSYLPIDQIIEYFTSLSVISEDDDTIITLR
ncbi:MAG: S41 family peptidase, partial [Bacilli bacterium]